MKTDDFITLLASQSPAVDRKAALRRFPVALLIGLAAATVLMALMLGLRPDLAQVVREPLFWWRLGFPVGIGVAALVAALRLARPGMRVGLAWAALAAPIAIAWAVSAVILAHAPEAARVPLIMGHTWKVCSTLIGMLSLPSLAGMLWAMRGMAPTHLRLAGAMAGLLAGASAAMAYCLHCPEMAPPFWSAWYLLGMLVPAALGALLGPRVLRW